eukprot:10321700-Prorocentrum_lima.AAC.1
MFQPICSDGYVTDTTDNQVEGPVDGCQVGFPGNCIGRIRAPMTTRHTDQWGEHGTRRASGRTLNSVLTSENQGNLRCSATLA